MVRLLRIRKRCFVRADSNDLRKRTVVHSLATSIQMNHFLPVRHNPALLRVHKNATTSLHRFGSALHLLGLFIENQEREGRDGYDPPIGPF